MSLCRICAHSAIAFLLRIVLGRYRPEEALHKVVRSLWRKYEWRAPNRLLVVFLKAHAAPQGLCENLINALLLQKDGDSLFQSVVSGLRDRSRKGTMEGLRNFI